MKFILLFTVALCLSISVKGQSGEKPVNIGFSKNIELVGYLIHLGDPDDKNNPEHPITKELDASTGDKSNTLLQEIFEIAGDMEYSLIIQLFYALPDFPLSKDYEIPNSIVNSVKGHHSKSDINILINKLNRFSKESRFGTIWSNLRLYREKTLEILQKNKPSGTLLSIMEQFYGQAFSSYHIVPSLTIWSGPGWGFRTENGRTATFILGPLENNYDFSDGSRFQNLAIHEFGHSFVDHVVQKTILDKIRETENLYLPLKSTMTQQGYANWESCVIEHFVRAGEVLVPELMGDSSMRENILEFHTQQKQFVYLPFIVERLSHYRIEKELSYPESVNLTMRDLQKAFQ